MLSAKWSENNHIIECGTAASICCAMWISIAWLEPLFDFLWNESLSIFQYHQYFKYIEYVS